MDLEEWEFLPDDGFLEIHDDGGKKIYSRKYSSGPTSVLETNYFVCPPKSSPQFVETTNDKLLPVPIHLEPTILERRDQEIPKQVPVEIKIMPSVLPEKNKAFNTGSASEADQDPVSQVFFKKMKDPEFVDMKVESPKSSRGGIMPQIDGAALHQFEENGETYKVEALVLDSKNCASKVKGDSEMDMEENNWGLNIWKWSLTGVGAICSFGVAAAAVSIIVFSSHQKSKQQNQKLQFQIYSNDKRIEQVIHHASKLNEAISAVRGVPLTRAHVTFGGYYEAH